jgi:Domain of unknown function (DUF5655)/Domain of unknown function (DUF4287)
MAATPEESTAKMVLALRETTGRSIEEWLTITRGSGKEKHGELVAFLKREHGVTHGYANLIAHQSLRSDAVSAAADGTDLVAEMFAGDKAGLRPILDAILPVVTGFGSDVSVTPKKGYLSLRRTNQFATLHPSTRTRFDVGLKLKGVPPGARLEAAGSWNAMVTHRVRLEQARDVDAELLGWLRRAYDGA